MYYKGCSLMEVPEGKQNFLIWMTNYVSPSLHAEVWSDNSLVKKKHVQVSLVPQETQSIAFINYTNERQRSRVRFMFKSAANSRLRAAMGPQKRKCFS